jgi:hypothetical protein
MMGEIDETDQTSLKSGYAAGVAYVLRRIVPFSIPHVGSVSNLRLCASLVGSASIYEFEELKRWC